MTDSAHDDAASPTGRSTAPQGEYTGRDVAIGIGIALVGTIVVFGIPLVGTV